MSQIGGNLKRCAILVHGWTGVGFCLIFLMWFLSGIVLIYCDFPAVSSADQLAHIRTLDPSKVQLSAEQAFARLKVGSPPVETSLSSFAGRPAYRFRFNRGEAIVYADNGETQTTVTQEMMLRVASAWTTQRAGTATASTLTEADQWTVSRELASQRPLRKFTWPDGEEVYVSMVTGDVVQCTTRASRIGAVLWSHSALALLHADTKALAGVESPGDLRVRIGDCCRTTRSRSRYIGLFKFGRFPPRRLSFANPLRRTETMAHDSWITLRTRRMPVGF